MFVYILPVYTYAYNNNINRQKMDKHCSNKDVNLSLLLFESEY